MLHSREVTGMAQKFTVSTRVASPIQDTSDCQHGCIMVSTVERDDDHITSDFVVVRVINAR